MRAVQTTHPPAGRVPRLLVGAVVVFLGASTARAQDPNAAPIAGQPVAPARSPRENFFTRLARGLDQVGAASMNVKMQRATAVNVDNPSVAPVPYNGAVLGVWRADLRDGVGVRLHVFLYNNTPQALTVPVPTAGLFALLDDHGRKLSSYGTMYGESAGGMSAPAVSRGAVTVPAMERVSWFLLFDKASADANELILRVDGAGVVRGIPAHPGAVVGMAPGAATGWLPNGQSAPAAPPGAAPPAPWPPPAPAPQGPPPGGGSGSPP